MKKFVIVVAPGLFFSTQLRAQENCSPIIASCRESFVRENMPTIASVQVPGRRDVPDPTSPYGQIAALLAAAHRLDKDFEDAKNRLEAADQGYDFPPRTPDDFQKMLHLKSPRDHAAVAAAEREFVAVQVEQHRLYNDAIAKTIHLFELVPKITNQQGGAAVPNVEPIRDWAPRFMEQQHYDFKEHRWVIEKHADARGVTSPDGRIRILPRGMESPEILAQSIFHETSHWLERNIRGQPFSKLENWNSEVLAYRLVLDNSGDLGIPAGSETQRRLEWYRDRYKYQYENPEKEGHDGSVWLEYDGDISVADDGVLPPESGRADPIDAVVSLTIAERRAAAEVRRSDFALRDSLAEIARKSCDSPEDLTQDELDALPAASGPDFAAIANPAGLDKCARDMLFKLETSIAGGAHLTVGVVRRRFVPEPATLPAPAPPPVRAARPEMAQFVAVPQIIRLACENPGGLTPQLFDYYLWRHVVDIPELAQDCRAGQSDLNPCVRGVWARLCGYGTAVNLTREGLLALAAQADQPAAPSSGPAPTTDNSPGERERPDRSSGKSCGAGENGGPSWCTP